MMLSSIVAALVDCSGKIFWKIGFPFFAPCARWLANRGQPPDNFETPIHVRLKTFAQVGTGERHAFAA
jgi:hypothetical protein